MRHKVKIFDTRQHREVAILIDQLGMPEWWPNQFATQEYLNRGKSHNSTRNMLYAVSMAKLWGKSVGKDFDYALFKGNFINSSEVLALTDFLDFKSIAQNEISQSGVGIVKAKNVSSAEAIRPAVKVLQAKRSNTVSLNEKGTRIRYIASYCEFVLNQRKNIEIRSGQIDLEFHAQAQRIISFFRGLAASINSCIDDEVLEAIDNETCQVIEDNLRPEAKDNPFQSPFVRARNYLIWRMFFDSGPRINELWNVKVSDIQYRDRQLDIRISKTRPRTVRLSQSTIAVFEEYVQNYWVKLPQSARANGWLWTQESGTRLSKDSISAMFRKIRERIPEVPSWFTSHTMRRTWNNRFSLMLDEKRAQGEGISQKKEAAIRNRLNGWSDNSQMAEVYNRRHTRKKADEVAECLMNNMISNGRHDEND